MHLPDGRRVDQLSESELKTAHTALWAEVFGIPGVYETFHRLRRESRFQNDLTYLTDVKLLLELRAQCVLPGGGSWTIIDNPSEVKRVDCARCDAYVLVAGPNAFVRLGAGHRGWGRLDQGDFVCSACFRAPRPDPPYRPYAVAAAADYGCTPEQIRERQLKRGTLSWESSPHVGDWWELSTGQVGQVVECYERGRYGIALDCGVCSKRTGKPHPIVFEFGRCELRRRATPPFPRSERRTIGRDLNDWPEEEEG